jgi:DNA-binding transcriptional LysR family regulator
MARPLAVLGRADLNLLTVFRALDETRHVTRASRLLGLSQPALSHALRRLRQMFGDPMFVRTPRGMTLTPLAESLAGPIRQALTQLEGEVLDRGPFRPAELTRTFKIRTTDYLEALVSPSLLAALAVEAEHVRFAALPVGTSLPKADLESGACDLAVAGFFEDIPSGFQQEVLFDDTFACAVRKGNPLSRAGALTLDAFCAGRHVLVAPSGELTGAVDRVLARRKRARRVVAGTSAFMVAAWICANSTYILTAPSRLLTSLAGPLGLRTFAPPISLPPIRVSQVWHERSHADPAHQWFRELVRRTTSEHLTGGTRGAVRAAGRRSGRAEIASTR